MQTDFSQIVFNQEEHRYYLNSQELISTTSYIKRFQKPFDRDLVARRVADREGRAIEEVLTDWDAKFLASQQLGIKVHRHIEVILNAYKNETNIKYDDPFLALNKCPEIEAFNQFWATLSRKALRVHETEWIIGDAELGLAGMVDALLYNRGTGYHLWDWKTGKFDTVNQWENLLPPFADMDASKLNIYSLQVSLYRLIVERNTVEIGDSYLLHLSPDGNYYIHKAVDFRPQLIEYFGKL